MRRLSEAGWGIIPPTLRKRRDGDPHASQTVSRTCFQRVVQSYRETIGSVRAHYNEEKIARGCELLPTPEEAMRMGGGDRVSPKSTPVKVLPKGMDKHKAHTARTIATDGWL